MSEKGIKAIKAATIVRQAAQDMEVLRAFVSLGGRWQGRVMEFRRHLGFPISEAQIKEAIKRLVEAGKIRVEGEKNAAKGSTYIVQT